MLDTMFISSRDNNNNNNIRYKISNKHFVPPYPGLTQQSGLYSTRTLFRYRNHSQSGYISPLPL